MKIKTLHVMDRLNVGGPARQLITLCERMRGPGEESILAVGDVEPEEETMEEEALARRLDLRRVPCLGRAVSPLRDAVAFACLVRLILKERPSVVHTRKSKAGALGRLAAWVCRVPVIVHSFHGHVLSGYFPDWKSRLFRRIEAFLARLSSRITVLSASQKRELLLMGIGREEQYRIIPPGLELESFLQAGPAGTLRAELGMGREERLIGIVGRLAPIKRHEDFLQAARLVLATEAAARFVIVGDGERRRELEGLARGEGLAGRVLFLGNRVDMPGIYPDLDVVALCSANEGVPLALIEAMACGRPVVASSVGGVPDLVEDGVTGLLVPPRDPRSLAAATLRLLADRPLAEALGSRGRARARDFTVEALVENTRALYRELRGAPAAEREARGR